MVLLIGFYLVALCDFAGFFIPDWMRWYENFNERNITIGAWVLPEQARAVLIPVSSAITPANVMRHEFLCLLSGLNDRRFPAAAHFGDCQHVELADRLLAPLNGLLL